MTMFMARIWFLLKYFNWLRDNSIYYFTRVMHKFVIFNCRIFMCNNVCLMRFYVTFYTWCKTILVISWRSVLLAKETGVHGGNRRPATGNWQTLSPMTWHENRTLILRLPGPMKARTQIYRGDRLAITDKEP